MSLQDEWAAMVHAQAEKHAAEREPTLAERAAVTNQTGGKLLERLFEAADQESIKPFPATPTNDIDGFSSDVARALGLTNH